MNDRFLVPTNSKKGNLIFGLFKPVDLIIAGSGMALSFALLIIFGVEDIWLGVVIMIPLMISALLVFPMPNYHNIRTFLGEMMDFYMGLRRYIWKGWCYNEPESRPKATANYTAKK